MIGILSNILTGYIISEQIREKYPNIDIYISNDIDKLLVKCKIVITSEDIKLEKNIIVLKIENYAKEDSYIIDDDNLLEAVISGNNKKIFEIVNNLNISSKQTIIINNPKILLIKHIIKEKYSNIIITSLDILITKLDKVIIDNDFNTNNSSKTIVIN